MRAKARQTFREAETLVANGQWSGAANRVYYALYQALVAEFEERGYRPGDFTSGRGGPGDRWSHAAIRKHAGLAGLSAAGRGVLESAWGLRVDADYLPFPIGEDRLRVCFGRVRTLLRRMEIVR